MPVDEMPHGSSPVRIKVLNCQGQSVDLGQILKWEDRVISLLLLSLDREGTDGVACFCGKGGSAEIGTLHVYQSKDGSNRYQLEANRSSA
jgi:hypothetical protein